MYTQYTKQFFQIIKRIKFAGIQTLLKYILVRKQCLFDKNPERLKSFSITVLLEFCLRDGMTDTVLIFK